MEQAIPFDRYFTNAFLNGDLIAFPTGMGEEIGRLGKAREVPYHLQLPLWSAHALLDAVGLALVREVHLNAVSAGCNITTTNTWKDPRAFAHVSEKWRPAARQAFNRAVLIAVDVKKHIKTTTGRDIYVGASFGPLAPCHEYQSQDLLPKRYLRKIHAQTANDLVQAAPDDIDFLIPETACNAREALVMAKAASRTGKPFIIGLSPAPNGLFWDGVPMGETIERIKHLQGFLAVALNCIRPENVETALKAVRSTYDGPLIVYANGLGVPAMDGVGWDYSRDDAAIEDHCRRSVTKWPSEFAITGLGGCCGTASSDYGKHLYRFIDERRQRLMTRDSGSHYQVA